jgi:hypothetical protein
MDGIIKVTSEGSHWWVNLELVAAARMTRHTVRGEDYTGRAANGASLRLYVAASTPVGEAMVVSAFGEEAVAIAGRLDELAARGEGERKAA